MSTQIWRRVNNKTLDQLIGDCLAAANTIGNARAGKSISRYSQTWPLLQFVLNSLYSHEMTDFILGHRAGPSRHLGEHRGLFYSDQVVQVGLHTRNHLRVLEGKHFRLQRSPQKCAQQDAIVWCATRKLNAT